MNQPAEDLQKSISDSDRYLVVLAGPNGAGKSTFFNTYLVPLGIRFVNADLIAQERKLYGYDAAVAADQIRRELLKEGLSFCMETVFSDPEGDKIEFLQLAQENGYSIIMIYIGLESRDLCIARVMQRVIDDGHDVPDDKIKARFDRSLKNLAVAARLVDVLFLFDNSSFDEPYRCFAKFEKGQLVWRTEDVPTWASQVCPPDT